MNQALDLGTLSTLRLDPLVLGAPSRATRFVWLLGAAGCLVFLWSVATTVGWLEPTPSGLRPGRLPSVGETFFWLLPLLLLGLALSLAVGGVRLTFGRDALELRSLWPNRSLQLLPWASFQYARFYTEQTRSRETLHVVRLVFADTAITCRVPNKKVWSALKERYGA